MQPLVLTAFIIKSLGIDEGKLEWLVPQQYVTPMS